MRISNSILDKTINDRSALYKLISKMIRDIQNSKKISINDMETKSDGEILAEHIKPAISAIMTKLNDSKGFGYELKKIL